MSIFYKHEDKELININELGRNQIKNEYDICGELIDFSYMMGQLYFADQNKYMKIHNLMFKDTYVYLSYCSKYNDISVDDKYYFDLDTNNFVYDLSAYNFDSLFLISKSTFSFSTISLHMYVYIKYFQIEIYWFGDVYSLVFSKEYSILKGKFLKESL